MKIGSAWRPCLVFVVICLAISGIAGWVTSAHIASWYEQLVQPVFRPPNWLFGPVWTVLYILIGISGGLLWQQRKAQPAAMRCYFLQLIFNFAWSFIFFGMQNIGLALIDIIILWALILLTILYSARVSKAVVCMLLPYFLWVTFATTLNASLWVLNG